MSVLDTVADRLRGWISLPLTTALLATFLLAFTLTETPQADPDLFARVAVGRLIDESGAVPIHDPFAFTPKLERWIDHEWLSGYVFYLLTQLGGDRALIIASLLTLFFTAWFLALAQSSYQRSTTVSSIWLLLALLDSRYLWASVIRAQVFTYLFLALWLWIFARVLRGGSHKFLILLPLTMVLWANAHGGFVVGLGLLAVVCGVLVVRSFLFQSSCSNFAELRSWFLALLAATLATAINPYGLVDYWKYILHATTMHRASISEWSPLKVFSQAAFVTDLLVLIILLGIFKLRRSLDPIALALLAASCYQAFRHERLGAIFLFIAVTFGLQYLESGTSLLLKGLRNIQLRLARAGAVTAALALPILVIVVAVRLISNFRLNYSGYPVNAIEWLWSNCEASSVPKRLLVDFNNGSYALWRLYPKFQISIDGRYEEVYPETTLAKVSDALTPSSPTQQASLKEVAPDLILRGAKAEWKESEFEVLYKDSNFVIHGRPESCNGTNPASSSMSKSVWEPRF